MASWTEQENMAAIAADGGVLAFWVYSEGVASGYMIPTVSLGDRKVQYDSKMVGQVPGKMQLASLKQGRHRRRRSGVSASCM